MKATTALLELLKEEREWRRFFRSCSEMSTHRLTTQSWQFRDELMGRNHHVPAEDVEDGLLVLARELLPQSPAAQWDNEWAHVLCKHSLSHLAEHYAGLSAEEKIAIDFSGLEVWDKRMSTAGLANDPAAFRLALKGWERAGMDAMKRVGVRGGAA